MQCSFARTAFCFLAAITLGIAAYAGELARPVPSDAQVTRFTRFNIRYTLRDIIAEGVQKVEFYISDDMGGTWRLYGEDPDKTSPMTVEVPGEGVYGFVSVVTDRFGNRERAPGPRTRPETVIVVDRTAPTAKWLAPTQDVLGRGQTVEMQWESADDYFGETPVKIQYAANAKDNHSPNANWQTARENLPANGSLTWTPPGSARYNFRLLAEDRAGNLAVAYCAATVRVDNTPPLVTAVTPLRSNKLENDIAVEARDNDDGSGVKEYSLYTSDNGSATWTLVKENVGGESLPVKRRPGETIAWKAPRSGEYPLWPVVFDEAGNATPLPSIGVAGPYILVVDNEPPQVTLSNSFLMGRAAVLANETRRIEWTSYDPHIQEGSARILLSLDNGNTWRELRSSMPANGFETVNFPFSEQSEEAKLKVTVSDTFGNVGESVSETFKLSAAETTIDSVTPRGGGSSQNDIFNTGPSDVGIAPSPAPTMPSTSGGWFGFGGSSDSSPQQPPPASIPGFNTSGGGADIYGGGSDVYRPLGGGYGSESSAGSVPQAMMRDTGRAGSTSGGGSISGGGSDIFGGYVPPPAGGGFVPAPPGGGIAPPSAGGDLPGFGSSSQDSAGWQPSPGAGMADSGLPSGFGGSWESAQPPASQSSDGGFGMGGLVPPPGGGTSAGGMGDWASSAPAGSGLGGSAADQWPSSTGELASSGLQPPAFNGFGDDAGVVAPPPVQPGSQSAFSEGFAAPGMGGLSLDSLGGGNMMDDLELPGAPLAFGGPDQTQPGGGGGSGFLRPPSSAPDTPDATPQTRDSGTANQPWPGVTDSMPPLAQDGPPPVVPRLDGESGGGLSLPQEIDRPQERPVNQRQASQHYVNQSKAFREENRVDLARDSAQKAVDIDGTNPAAYMELAQVNARMEPPDYVTAANLAKEATNLQADWETWWNCADVFYVWANASNREIQAMQRNGQTPPINLIDERNSTLSNANIAINNAASVLPPGDRAAAKKVVVTQGMIAYQRALTVPEPSNPGATEDAYAMEDYRRRQAEYKASVSPLLQEAMPYFRSALSMGGAPEYSETFQLGIINFRLAGLERDTGNAAQATTYYQDAVTYLEQATNAANAPKEGPREAYYMLAHSHDQLSGQPTANRARHRELALRYWRQTADFYDIGSPYRIYAEQRIEALSEEMGL